MYVSCFVMWYLVPLFGNHLAEEEKVECFTLIVFLVSCDCLRSVALPHGAMGFIYSM